jgi:AcrR family transcriptional regulator
MLTAARALLVREGPTAVTHQRVARLAGVGRATVYRHWTRPEQLLLDAMVSVDLPFFRDPVAPLRRWLREQLQVVAYELALPEVAAITATMLQSVGADNQLTQRRDGFVAVVTDRVFTALTLAATNGELDLTADPRDVTALLIGPILYRISMQTGPVSDDLIDRIVDSVGTWHSSA